MNDTSETTNQKKSTKILILGLDNSGKTSILLTLQGEKNLLSYYALKPTPGLNITSFEMQDTNFNIWEFGGQKQYRMDYLKKLKEYIREADKVIYVIDIQDLDRYEIALQYFSAILHVLKQSDHNFQLSIFLHKFDPDLMNNPEFTDEKITVRLINPLREIIDSEIEFAVFKTSIFTIFRKTALNLEFI